MEDSKPESGSPRQSDSKNDATTGPTWIHVDIPLDDEDKKKLAEILSATKDIISEAIHDRVKPVEVSGLQVDDPTPDEDRILMNIFKETETKIRSQFGNQLVVDYPRKPPSKKKP